MSGNLHEPGQWVARTIKVEFLKGDSAKAKYRFGVVMNARGAILEVRKLDGTRAKLVVKPHKGAAPNICGSGCHIVVGAKHYCVAC